jgi:hypothetical protein
LNLRPHGPQPYALPAAPHPVVAAYALSSFCLFGKSFALALCRSSQFCQIPHCSIWQNCKKLQVLYLLLLMGENAEI